MAKDKTPVSPAIRMLRASGVAFTDHLYDYEDRGGTEVSARELGVDEHAVVKTLVMEDDAKRPLVVLMHGDRKVSTKELARTIGVKTIQPCNPETANRHSGYMVGGTSPFGTRKEMPARNPTRTDVLATASDYATASLIRPTPSRLTPDAFRLTPDA
jgi:Cys-tRNA(Pro) deacylase